MLAQISHDIPIVKAPILGFSIVYLLARTLDINNLILLRSTVKLRILVLSFRNYATLCRCRGQAYLFERS